MSLLPSATELVCAVGMREALVGVSHECDFPPSVAGTPVLTSSRLSLSFGDSEAVDRDVRDLLARALAIYEIDVEALKAADPDVVVTQDLCDVCAVPRSDVEVAVAEHLGGGVKLVNLSPTRLEHVWDDLITVGRALGVEAAAEAKRAELLARVEDIERRAQAAVAARGAGAATASAASGDDASGVAARGDGGPARPRVLTLEWLAPPMVGGTWMPQLVELAGGEPLVTQAGDGAPTLRRDQLALLDPAPDVVLVKPCGFTLERALGERQLLADLLVGLPWPALERGAVFAADGNAYFNRSGPRLVESLEILAACVHPEVFGDFATEHAGSFTRVDLAG